MKSLPLIEIILPVYNQGRYLPQMLRSLINQTESNWLCRIIDDGSKEDIQSIVRVANDSRFHYQGWRDNHGLPATLNAGFEITTASYVTWVSADCACHEWMLADLYNLLHAHNEHGMIFAEHVVWPGKAKVPQALLIQDLAEPELNDSAPTAAAEFETDNHAGACFLYRGEAIREVLPIAGNIQGAEDWELHNRVIEKWPFIQVKNHAYYYWRQHGDSISGRDASAVDRATADLRRRWQGRLTGRDLGVPDLCYA